MMKVSKTTYPYFTCQTGRDVCIYKHCAKCKQCTIPDTFYDAANNLCSTRLHECNSIPPTVINPAGDDCLTCTDIFGLCCSKCNVTPPRHINIHIYKTYIPSTIALLFLLIFVCSNTHSSL